MDKIPYEDFLKVDIRVEKIISVEDFPEARNPTYILQIDFGEEIGVKKSSTQITENYSKDELPGKYIFAVLNFPPKQIGPFMSEVLTLGVYKEDSTVVLATADKNVQLGARLL